MFESFLCTEVIFTSFSKDRNVDYPIELFRLVKIKSTNKAELFLISLVGISECCVALFISRFLIYFKISFSSMNEKLNFELANLSLIAITRG